MLYAKDCKQIQVPINPAYVEFIAEAADKNNKSIRQWMRYAIEEKLALLGYIDEP